MLRRARSHVTYANVMATAAVFIALGGSSYAALKVTGKDVRNGSLTNKDLKRNTLGGGAIKESKLKKVPNAARLNGVTARRLLVGCPRDTFPAGGTCIEAAPRSPLSYGSATFNCKIRDAETGVGRRLPTHGELTAAFSRVKPAPGGELTGDISPRAGGGLDVIYVTDEVGSTAVVPNDGNFPKAFRCAVDPLN